MCVFYYDSTPLRSGYSSVTSTPFDKMIMMILKTKQDKIKLKFIALFTQMHLLEIANCATVIYKIQST